MSKEGVSKFVIYLLISGALLIVISIVAYLPSMLTTNDVTTIYYSLLSGGLVLILAAYATKEGNILKDKVDDLQTGINELRRNLGNVKTQGEREKDSIPDSHAEKSKIVGKVVITDTKSTEADVRTEALLERYRQSWNQQVLIHELQWRGITILTPVIAGLVGLSVIYRAFVWPIAIASGLIIGVGLFITYRNREVFLQHMMIIARVERLLGLHKKYPKTLFKDDYLLPIKFVENADMSYDDFIKDQFWKKKTTFFGVVVLYLALLSLVILTSIVLLRD